VWGRLAFMYPGVDESVAAYGLTISNDPVVSKLFGRLEAHGGCQQVLVKGRRSTSERKGCRPRA